MDQRYPSAISCGAITVKIIDKGEKIIWKHVAKQINPDEIGDEMLVGSN